jgi:hypothetical protein
MSYSTATEDLILTYYHNQRLQQRRKAESKQALTGNTNDHDKLLNLQ